MAALVASAAVGEPAAVAWPEVSELRFRRRRFVAVAAALQVSGPAGAAGGGLWWWQ